MLHPRRATMLAASALLVAALSTPLLARLQLPLASFALRKFFSFVCHEIPERSFWVMGQPIAICIRCFGIYSGVVLGTLIQLPAKTSRQFLVIAALLNAMDVGAESLGLHGDLPLLRLSLGIVLGASVGALACSSHRQANNPFG